MFYNITIICSVISITISIFGLLGYVLRLQILGSVRPDYIPMAPSTALFFILFSLFLILSSKKLLGKTTNKLFLFLTFLITWFSSLKIIEYLLGRISSFEEKIINITWTLGDIPVGVMSPSTGMFFFFCGIAFIFIMLDFKNDKYLKIKNYIIGLISTFLFIGSTIFLIAYVIGQPLLYDTGSTIPMAVTTAIAFLFLSISIISFIGPNHLPLSVFHGSTTKDRILKTFIPLTVFIVFFEILSIFFIQNLFNINDSLSLSFLFIIFSLISGFIVYRVGSVVGNSINQKEQKRLLAESKLSRSENKLSATFDSMGDGLFVVDKNCVVEIFNHSASIILGFTEKDIINKKYNKLIKFSKSKNIKLNNNFIEDAIKNNKSYRISTGVEIVLKNNIKIPVYINVSPIRDKNKTIGAVIIFRNISEELEISKMKSEFVTLTSHQLRTPLTAVKWSAELLLREKNKELTSLQKELIDEIYKSNERLIWIVNDLLNVSHIETGKKFNIIIEKHNITDIFHTILEEKKRIIKERKIKFITYNKALELPLDKLKIMEVFSNVIDNAIKYSNIGGTVWINCDMQQKDNVIISIKDEGIGIPKNIQNKIFDRFIRGTNAVIAAPDGTGLGLYFAKEIIKAHGGKMWFESIEGKGSTFYFSLHR